jgi:hypothetical protein
MKLVRFLVCALVAVVGLCLFAVFLRRGPSTVADCGNGLNAAQRLSFHHVSHGYEITPRPTSGGEVYFARAMEGALSAHLRRPRLRSAMSASRRPGRPLRVDRSVRKPELAQ